MTRHRGDAFVAMTQNAWGAVPAWPRRRDALARAIAQHGADVVGLQEVHAPRPDGAQSQAHELAAALGGYDAFFAPGRVAPDGRCEGVALLCKRDVREHSVEALTLDPTDLLERTAQRVVLCANLDLPEGPVDVFVTHLSLSRRARARTVVELRAFAERERARSKSIAAVLMGDFNALPDEPAVRALAAREGAAEHAWHDAWRAANPGRARGATWPSPLPFRRIDYVFVQPAARWEIAACDVAEPSGSDHRAVVARLALRADPAG